MQIMRRMKPDDDDDDEERVKKNEGPPEIEKKIRNLLCIILNDIRICKNIFFSGFKG